MTDEIFLLSIEEYEKYKNAIPKIINWWWLRSPGDLSSSAAGVANGGSVGGSGYYVDDIFGCVRPALHLESNNLQIGSRTVKYDFPWIVIDKNLAIAEVPIMFDKFDDKSKDYEKSYIRQKLHEWLEERK